MNFLKRAGAIFMLLAIFASSCNKYADDFTQVNTKLDAIATSVAGLSTLNADLTTIKGQISGLVTAMAAQPNATTQAAQFAAVTAQLTTMSTAIASLDTQIKAVTTSGTATKAVVDKLALDLKALSDKVTADNAKILLGQTDAMTKLNAMDVKITGLAGLDTKMTAMAATMDALTVAVAGNKSDIAALATKLTDQAAAIAAIGTDLAANTAADATAATAAAAAVVNAAAANATLLANNATILADVAALTAAVALNAQTGTDADTVTSQTIKGLQLMLDAQKVQLDLIIANTALKVTDVTIAGTLNVGGILTASPVPSSATVTYQWKTATTAGGTYVDIAGATTNKYTIVAGDLNNFFKVKVTGTGSYANSDATSLATATAVGAQIAMVSVGAPVVNTSGDPLIVGKKLKTGTLNPTVSSGATVTYQWQSSNALTGVYADIAGATASTYTPVLADANMYIKVVVTGTLAYTGVVTSTGTQITAAGVVSPSISGVAGNNLITITLTDGTFKSLVAPATFTAADFTFAGTNAGLFASAVYTRVSNTVVTAQLAGSSVLTPGALLNVTVPPATLATASTGVTIAASTVLAILDPVVALAYATLLGDNTIAVTLTGGTYKAGTITKDDFTIGGPNAALINAGTFVRTSSTVVTITTAPMAASAANTLTVNIATQATQAASVACVSSSIAAPDVLSPAFSTIVANNAVTVTLTGGTFAAGITQADLTWAGTDAGVLGTGTLTYVDATHIVVTDIILAGGADNNVTVLSTGISTFPGVLSVSCVASTKPNIVSGVFTSTATHIKITITLGSGGMWKSGAIANTDFNFSGNGANALNFAGGTFTRTSDTVVTVTGLALVAANNNVITVLPNATAAGTSVSVVSAP